MKILIIDEEPMILAPLTDRITWELKNVEYKVMTNVADALAILSKESFNVIILDMLLPWGENEVSPGNDLISIPGMQILKEIRHAGLATPVICYTIFNMDHVIDEITSLSAVYINKNSPDSFSRLFDKLQKILKI